MEKYKLLEKAYEIDLSRIEEYYFYEREIAYAETVGKAKSKLLGQANYNNMKLLCVDEDMMYTNIPVKRAHDYDKYEFEGKAETMHSIYEIIHERERISKLNDILTNDSIKFCYISKGNYYRPGSCGYTDFKHRAGVFTKEEAVSSAKSCSGLSIIPIDIEVHNKMISDEITELQTRLLK